MVGYTMDKTVHYDEPHDLKDIMKKGLDPENKWVDICFPFYALLRNEGYPARYMGRDSKNGKRFL
jgi:hypothetical protein